MAVSLPEESSSPPDPRTPDRGLTVAAAIVVALIAAGVFLPRSPDYDFTYGVDSWADLGVGAFAAAGVALALLFLLPGAAERIGRGLAKCAARIPPRAGAALLVAGFAALAALLPSHTLSGDAGTVVFLAALERVHPSNALTCYLFRLLEAGLSIDPVHAIRLASILSGAVYAAGALGLARECAPAGPRRAGIAAVLLTTGSVAIFFGTVEVYAPVGAAVTVFLLLAIRDLRREGRTLAPALCLGIAFCLHGSALLLAPALLLTANRGRFRPLLWRRWLAPAAVFLAPILATAALLYFVTWDGRPPAGVTNRYGTFLGTEGEGPFLPLLLSPHQPRQRYAILEPEHLAGMANLLLLLAPVGVALLVLGRRRLEDPVFRLVALGAACLFLLANVWNASYALRRDWDLFSSLGPPVALLGALAWFGTPRSAGAVVRVAALSLFTTAPFVLSNSLSPTERGAFGYDMSSSLERAVPWVAASEVAAELRLRARAQGLTTGGLPPEDVRSETEAIVHLAIDEFRLCERAVLRYDRATFGRDLAAALRREMPGADHAGLSAILAEEIGAAISARRDLGEELPVPGALAASAVRRALDRPDTARTLGTQSGDDPPDLVILDAVDDAMAGSSGFTFARPRGNEGEWEQVLIRNFGILARESGSALDTRRWGVLAAEAIRDLLDESRAREESLRWLMLDDAAEAWTRRTLEWSPAGLNAAVARAEWIAAQESIPAEERYAIAERHARHGLRRYPGNASWLSILAGSLYLQGRTGEAEACYRAAIRARPGDLDRRLDLALVLHKAGRNEEAMKILSRAVRLGPWHGRCAWALALLAEIAVQEGDPDLARSVANCALETMKRQVPREDASALHMRILRVLDGVR